jgi:hypothetical protein
MTNEHIPRTSDTPDHAADHAAGHPRRTAGTAPVAARWTARRIRELGAVTDLQTAAVIFGLSRTTAYELARTDQFPVPVLRFGSRYRVPVPAILSALGLPTGDDEPTTRPAEAGQPPAPGRLDHCPDPRVDHPDAIRCPATAAPPQPGRDTP